MHSNKINQSKWLIKNEVSEISYGNIGHSIILYWSPNKPYRRRQKHFLRRNINSQHMDAVNVLLKQTFSEKKTFFQKRQLHSVHMNQVCPNAETPKTRPNTDSRQDEHSPGFKQVITWVKTVCYIKNILISNPHTNKERPKPVKWVHADMYA